MQSDIELPDGWVFQDQVPARAGVDYGYWVVGRYSFNTDNQAWWPITEDRNAGKRHGYKDFEHSTLCVMCRVEDYPVTAASPDDWVPLTDKIHVLRRDVDWIEDLSPLSGCSGDYEQVRTYAGRLASDRHIGGARCLRKHHPDYQPKVADVEPQTFRIGDIVRFRGGVISYLVAWVAKDGMVRLADHGNPAYWCKPAVLEFVSRAEGPYQW